MNREEVFKHYSHILDTLIDDTLFYKYFFQYPFCLEEDICGCFNKPWNIHFGATRACVEDETYPYVIKTNLQDFTACEDEEEAYRDAVNEGLENYFCEMCFLGFYTKDIDFYPMAAIEDASTDIAYMEYFDEEKFVNWFNECEDELGKKKSIRIMLPLWGYMRAVPHDYNEAYNVIDSEEENEYKIAAKKVHSPLRATSLAIAMEFVREYGEKEYERLSYFLDNWCINDLHFGNFGDIDGHICCLDWAGYNRGSSWTTED